MPKSKKQRRHQKKRQRAATAATTASANANANAIPVQTITHSQKVSNFQETAKGISKELAVKNASTPEAKALAKEKQKKDAAKQKQTKIMSLISSCLIFFFVPILVSSIKIMEIMNNIIMTKSPTDPVISRYDGFVFLFIIFISIYSIVKSVLGSTSAFIYMVFASMAVCYKAYKMYME